MAAPKQLRSLDPFSDNRFSSTINRLSRIVTGGDDVIFHPEASFLFEMVDYRTLRVNPGLCNKDDVLIHVTEPYDLDFMNGEFFVDSDVGMDTEGKYYILLQYSYFRSLPGPKAYIKILRNIDQNYIPYVHRYLFLGLANVIFSSSNMRYEIVSFDYEDKIRNIYRKYPKLSPDVVDGGIV